MRMKDTRKVAQFGTLGDADSSVDAEIVLVGIAFARTGGVAGVQRRSALR
jgi:hypothetical protein